jgi:hypothetical protein
MKEHKSVKSAQKREIAKLRSQLRSEAPATFHQLLSAILIWLFGILVFIPLAASIGHQTAILVTLAFFATFTVLIVKASPGLKGILDSSSVLPARKYGPRLGLDFERSLMLFRQLTYMMSSIVLYLLYYPFLSAFHPAINGVVLILVLIWIFLLALGISAILARNIKEWLYPARVD